MTHINTASAKSSKSVTAISRLMPNIAGPSRSKRALLMSVTQSQLLYSATIWAGEGVKTAKNHAALNAVQRRAALRIARRYRTVSDSAAFVVTRLAPADILAVERGQGRDRKK